MKRIEIQHKNQCDGIIPDGFILCDRIESNGLIHDFYVGDIFISKLYGELKDFIIVLEDTI